MIRHTSFKHGWFYHYRQHTLKTEDLCKSDLLNLNAYLGGIHEKCPDKYFSEGPRSSKLKFFLNVDLVRIEGHEVCSLAAISHKNSHYKTAHSRVQTYMLENDDSTLAVEVPIWLEPQELDSYSEIFESDMPLSGHIDALRVEDGKIWIWDYKPKADKERYASTQVFFYAYMLSRRTGIPLDDFRCGYFDEKEAFVFRPEENLLSHITK